ncbi:LytR/AlgR family response regulator transcription factor [Aquimarina brevivitae]|uniref:LytTR family two component transcriptional regulator n=1 Tax=Aquimarina brevivitae TaxID=323412 RepID=A0A4Q7NUT2_9FLAO|nr:LytTR family DNA-binding domain-containing protein [Aquimarina brevivitae]RZS90700.1 LytTR family two component transcriptional regulator [Aquimarina brevivitae]
MIKAILVEDESYIRKGLINLIDSLDKEITVIGECGSVQEAVTVVSACKPDLVFLDIHLPDGNAFDFLAQTNDLNFKVIFITAYDHYALKALKAGAVDYILKPVDVEELETAIDKISNDDVGLQQQKIAVTQSHFNQERLVIGLQNEYKVININELQYCKSDKGYTTFYLTDNRKVLASKPLKFFLDKLPAAKFVRTHQSCLVNLDYVDRYDKSGVVILKNNAQIPVSVRKKEEFLAKLISNGQ